MADPKRDTPFSLPENGPKSCKDFAPLTGGPNG